VYYMLASYSSACRRVELSLRWVVCSTAFVWCCSNWALAAPISYGDKVGQDVTYRMIKEDSSSDTVPPCMYCEPTVGGNTLNFNPVGFDAASSNGSAADITDGQLLFMIESNDKQNKAIQNFVIDETGDTTLSGNVPVGSLTTSTAVFLAPVVEIVEVDGVALAVPITLTGMSTPPLPVLTTVFSELPSNTLSDGTWHLGVDGNGGPIFFTQWHGRMLVDVQDALIKSGTPFIRGATKVTVNIDNVLGATSVEGTSATIAKKDLITITTNIPEPATLSLLLMAATVGMISRRRR
jgi:hypothetical protein